MGVLYSYVSVDVYVRAFRFLGTGIRETKEKRKKINIFLVITNGLFWASF